MSDPVIGYRFPRGLGCQTIHEDAAGGQYVIGDEGRRVYGVFQIPEEECLRTAASASDPVIGQRLFTDGIERDVFGGDQGQYVLGPDGERVHGTWTMDDEALGDMPVVAWGAGRNEC